MLPLATRRPLLRLALLLLLLVAVVLAALGVAAQDEQLATGATVAAASELLDDGDLPLETVSDAAAFSHREVLGLALAGLAVFVAAGGGTGGGGILDPIYILVMQLDAKTAIPLSSITIVGGAVANLLINVRRARKHSTQPLIDWDFILVMQPMLLVGASFGTFINRLAPTWLLCVLLVIVLAITGVRTLQKAVGAGRQEWWFPSKIGGRGAESARLLGVANSSDLPRAAPFPPVGTSSRGRRLGTAQDPPRAEQEPTADIPWRKIGMLFGLFLGIVALSLLQMAVPQTSFFFLLVVFLPSIFLMVFISYSMRNVTETFRRQQNPYYILSHGEIQWTPSSIRYFPLLSIAAGMVAGMFGLGGGIINGPLLLEIGIDPSAASAMTATTVLFSSAMSSVNYILLGSLDFSFAAIMFPMGFLTTFVGHVCLLRIVQRYRCPSLVIFSMAIVVLVSAVAMSIESIKELTSV